MFIIASGQTQVRTAFGACGWKMHENTGPTDFAAYRPRPCALGACAVTGSRSSGSRREGGGRDALTHSIELRGLPEGNQRNVET